MRRSGKCILNNNKYLKPVEIATQETSNNVESEIELKSI